MRFFGKFFTSIILATAFVLVGARVVLAADLVVNCPNSTTYAVEDAGANCVFSHNNNSVSGIPLFLESNFQPGDSRLQTITINNQDVDESCALSMNVDDTFVDDPNLAAVLRTAIYNQTGHSLFGSYSGAIALENQKLQDLFDVGSLNLGSIPAGHSLIINWLLTLDGASVGNQYQGVTTRFDFDISFTCGDPTLTPTPTPTPTGGSDGGGGGGGGGAEDANPPYCEIPNSFVNTPTGFSVVSGLNSATLQWNEYPSAQQYAIFFYDSLGAEYSVLGSIIGNATSFTIGNLSGTGWTFELIAIGGNDNLCSSPRAIASGLVAGGILTGPPVGPGGAGDMVEGDVLGEVEEEEDGESSEMGGEQTLGVTTSCTPWKMYLPWILLVAQLISLLIVEYFTRHSSSKSKYLYIIFITAITNVLFYLLRECICYDFGSILAWLCKWFWVASVLESLLIRLIGYGFIEVVDKD